MARVLLFLTFFNPVDFDGSVLQEIKKIIPLITNLYKTYLKNFIDNRMLFEYLNNNPSPYNEETIESFAKHSSLMEQKAAEAERASVKYKMAELMKKHEGEIFEARISGITEWGIYATILDLHAEGLIRVSEIKSDRFYYVEDERKLIGKRTKRSFHMGDIITIKVKSANPIARQIDFYLYE